MVTELNEYGLPEEETLVLKEFERITGKTLPKVDRVMWVQKTSKKGINTSKHQLGFMIEDGHIIGLGLCPRVHGSVVNPYFQLSFIPESIRKLKKLRILDLSSNGLTLFSGVTPIGGESNPGLNLLPDWFGNLTTLEELNLSWNKLTSLPESFGNLKNLKILHLYKNKIRKLPESIGNLKKLQEIYLSQNELTTLPNSFCDLRSLQEIDLQRNKLSSIPENFGHLIMLRTLSLAENAITSLPESFGQLISLQSMHMPENKLKTLPESFQYLNSLHTLNLYHNQLSYLPESFGKIIVLTDLDLRYNLLKTLPVSFVLLKSLKNLHFDKNLWTEEYKKITKMNFTDFNAELRKKAGTYIFIIHDTTDTDFYKIENIAQNLETYDDIFQIAYHDWKFGNNPKNIKENILNSHIVVFLATLKSLKSKECRYHLDLARKNNLKVIPVKGVDIPWENLAVLQLDSEIGIEYSTEFDYFCSQLYKMINPSYEISETSQKSSITNKIKTTDSPLDDMISTKKKPIDKVPVDLKGIGLKNRIKDVINSEEFFKFIMNNYPKISDKMEISNAELTKDIISMFKVYMKK